MQGVGLGTPIVHLGASRRQLRLGWRWGARRAAILTMSGQLVRGEYIEEGCPFLMSGARVVGLSGQF